MLRVIASPKLKALTSTMPKAALFKATAASNSTKADGQGTKPPEMPSASSERQVTASPAPPGGRCECIGPPPCECIPAPELDEAWAYMQRPCIGVTATKVDTRRAAAMRCHSITQPMANTSSPEVMLKKGSSFSGAMDWAAYS